MSVTDQNSTIDNPTDALQANPNALVSALRSYSRCKFAIHPDEWKEAWGGKRGGRVNMVSEPPVSIDRIMKDLHGSMNIVQYGYIITKVQEIKEPYPETDPEDRPPYSEQEDVYRISFEPIAKFLAYAATGYYFSPKDEFIDGAPTRG